MRTRIQEEQDALWEVIQELQDYVEQQEIDLQDSVAQLEIEQISRALRAAGRNHTNAAKLLQLNRTTLLAKMKKYNL